MWSEQQSVGQPAMTPIPGGVAGFQIAVAESFFPYEVDTVATPGTFESSGAVGRIGPLRLSRTCVGSPFAGGRPRAQRCGYRYAYVLMLVESGRVHLRGRRAAVADAGDLILMNCDKAIDTQQEVAGTSLAVSIPASTLKLRYAEVDDWCLIPLPTSAGAPYVLRDCLTSYWYAQAALSAPEYNDLAMSLIHLIGACFRDRCDLPHIDSQSMHAHLMRIRAMVAERLVDPDLSIELIATQLGISKSYLFMIMNAANTTLGRYILDQRLECSRQMLGDPALKSRTISEIAFSVGFKELSHFSRCFAAKFGRSPRAYRAGAQAVFAQPAA